MSFPESYLGRLREKIGSDLVLMPGARCVLLDTSGRVLLEQRSDFRLWGLPGGCPESGEDLHETAIREIKEEVGLDVDSLKAFGFSSDPEYETVTFPNGDRCQYFVLLLWSIVEQQDAYVASDESLEVAWHDWDKLPDDIMPNTHRSLEAFERFRTTDEFQIF